MRCVIMLNEIIEYSNYTDPSFEVKRLKYKILSGSSSTTSIGGLNRALSIVARRFCYYNETDEATPLCSVEALKSWCGFGSPCEGCENKNSCEKYNKVLELNYWFPKYILCYMKQAVLEKHKGNENLIQILNKIDELENNIGCFLEYNLTELYSLVNSLQKVNKLCSILQNHQHNCKNHYNVAHISLDITYDDSKVKNDEIKFDSIVSSAIDLGPLKERVMLVQTEKDIIPTLSKSGTDKVEKVLATFLLSRDGESIKAKIPKNDVTNWFEKGDKFLPNKPITDKFVQEDDGIIPNTNILDANYFLIDINELDKYRNQGYTAYFDQGQKDKFVAKNI